MLLGGLSFVRRLEYIQWFVIDRAVDPEEWQDAVKDMILPDLFLRIYFQRFIRCPHDERNLDLFLRRDKYGHAVHIQIPLAEGLSVVGYEDHATAPLGNPAKNFYYGK